MKLAIHDGEPIRTKPFPAYNVIGKEEKRAVNKVLDSGVLSRYLGAWGDSFYGGPEVRALEEEWADYFGAEHAIAVNSCTSGLYAAVGAAGVYPGEEIIVSPYTMTASATAALVFNSVPIFADIEEDFFCLDPASIEARISSKTKAIIAVDIFGLPYDADAVNIIAKKHGLIVIEDCAQAPGALFKGKWAGSLGDMGIFSLNYHKHIHCGEGGVVVTDNDEFADRVRLIRNHGEMVVDGRNEPGNLANMIGFNFRMPEIEAAIARCQLKKLADLVDKRQRNCEYLAERIEQIPAIIPPKIRTDCTHSYYVHPFKFDEEIAGVSRNKFIDAVKAELPVTELRETEGTLISSGYVKPLYLIPLYQKKIAFGTKGWPFSSMGHDRSNCYEKGQCPVAERMYEKEFFSHELMRPGMSKKDLDDVVTAFEKVWDLKKTLSP